MVKIVIIDYLGGNLFSIVKAFKYLGFDVIVSNNPSEWIRADVLVFPGQGNFYQAIQELSINGKILVLKEVIKNKLFLGICLGMQILFEESEEAPGVNGLSIFKGKVKKLPSKKIPHLGWNQVKIEKESILFKGISNNSFFYFVHSYYVVPEEDIVIGRTSYEIDFPSFIQKDNIVGTQFHPEKSSKSGLRFLENLLKEYIKE